MKTKRNISGSILPSSSPEVLRPIPFNGCVLQVVSDDVLDTHNLYLISGQSKTLLASHPNGHSCHSLAKRMVAGDLSRVMEQSDYILRCGGSSNPQVIEELVGANI